MDETESENAAYEARLQRRLVTLKEEMAAGRIVINSDLKVIESLKAIRYGRDGKVDLSTVDGFVRSMAIAVEYAVDRRKLKEAISLHEIQNNYFEFLDNHFGTISAEMVKAGVTPHDIAEDISTRTPMRGSVAKWLPDFLAAIEEFWENVGPVVHIHLEDMHGPLKCVFGGDLFPSDSENLASKCGIYTDTIILPDPFLRSREILSRANETQLVYYTVKHALNVLQYKELACAGLDPPIVVIAPDYTALEKGEKDFVQSISEIDALYHAEKIFGRTFSSAKEFVEFATKLDTVDTVLAEIREPEKVLFDSEWGLSPRDSILRAQQIESSRMFGITSPGILMAATAFGRMATANELLIKARRFGGSPIIDAPTSWQYFTWKLEYDAERAEEETASVDLHVLRGLQALSQNEMQWLGHVPPDALIELRRADALPEIRQMLGKGVDLLTHTNPTNFYRTTDKIFDNIHDAFSEHQKKIDALKAKKWKFATKDIGTWLAVGTIEVAAALTGTPVWGLATIAANQIVDPIKLKDIPASIKKLAAENEKLKRSPVGMLFRYKK